MPLTRGCAYLPRRKNVDEKPQGRHPRMQRIREEIKQRPVAWFFAIALAAEILVVSVLLFSGALAQLEAAIETVWGGAQRTDFVSAFRLAVEAPQAVPGIAL